MTMPARTRTTAATATAAAAAPLSFPMYLLPPLPFLRSTKKHTSSPSSTTNSDTSTHTPPPALPGTTQLLKCRGCLADLCTTASINSKGFTGRHGRAYLLSSLSAGSSIRFSPPIQRTLITGMHTVSDMACAVCGEDLGWRYDGAEKEDQRYKVGRYILEREKVVKVSAWEVEDEVVGSGVGDGKGAGGKEAGKGKEDVKVNVNDEVEMEWLFTGAWTAEKALERRGKLAA